MKKEKGFTLIELLVVISIIALLLSILMPGLQKAKEMARKTLCATNLHQWGLALTTYYNDYEKLLSTVNTWDQGHEGCIAWVSDARIAAHPDQFNLKAIDGYLKGFDYSSRALGDTWLCPSNRIGYADFQKGLWDASGFVQMQYSYWARVDLWGSDPDQGFGATHPKQLTGRDLSSTKVLMADTVWGWPNLGAGWVGFIITANTGLPSTTLAFFLVGMRTWGRR